MYKAFTFFSLLYLTIDASNNDKIKIIIVRNTGRLYCISQ